MRIKKDSKCPFCGLVNKHIRNCNFLLKVLPKNKSEKEFVRNKKAIILGTDTK